MPSKPPTTPGQITRKSTATRTGLRAPWKKGDPSPNPGGRPKTAHLSRAMREELEKIVPGDRQARTYAQAIARRIVRQAMKGSVLAVRELADRTEGKVPQAITGPEGGALPAPLLQAAIVIANMTQDELAGFVSRHELTDGGQDRKPTDGKQDG